MPVAAVTFTGRKGKNVPAVSVNVIDVPAASSMVTLPSDVQIMARGIIANAVALGAIENHRSAGLLLFSTFLNQSLIRPILYFFPLEIAIFS